MVECLNFHYLDSGHEKKDEKVKDSEAEKKEDKKESKKDEKAAEEKKVEKKEEPKFELLTNPARVIVGRYFCLLLLLQIMYYYIHFAIRK